MKIVGRLVVTLVSAATAIGMAVVGCGTTNNIDTGGKTSQLGESCTRTFDCAAGLVCLQGTCFKAAPTMEAGTVDGGEGGVVVATGPHLGQVNESCQTTIDCQAPLACVGNACRAVSYNLTSTGKSCSGECNTPADCCEIPVGGLNIYFQQWFTPYDGGPQTSHGPLSGSAVRCEDLLAFIGGDATICNQTTFPIGEQGLSEGCFAYNAYCKCAANTWACNANQCSYTAPCSTGSGAIGCPSETRTGRALSATCNITGSATTGSCQAGCATPADCSGTFPLGTNHACSLADAGPSNCTCYQSACYFKCSKDIDCASGSTCDTTTSLCKKAGCTTAADCVQSTGNAKAQCNAGACQIACTEDIECSPPSTICSAGFCKAAGCSSDANCASNSHVFCVPATTTTYTSAVTN